MKLAAVFVIATITAAVLADDSVERRWPRQRAVHDNSDERGQSANRPARDQNSDEAVDRNDHNSHERDRRDVAAVINSSEEFVDILAVVWSRADEREWQRLLRKRLS